ncbi:hypothetical protein BBP40_008240 [Aspergillus hancockii]|nr:hypothetical protein BBP40_008240 [Aspergillus hancockii]
MNINIGLNVIKLSTSINGARYEGSWTSIKNVARPAASASEDPPKQTSCFHMKYLNLVESNIRAIPDINPVSTQITTSKDIIIILTPPTSFPTLPSVPLQEPVGDFCLAKSLARTIGPDSADKRAPFVEATIDQAWTLDEISARVAQVAAALCSSWQFVPGQKRYKIVAILASNSVDTLILSWAIHGIGGACLMLQPTSSAEEIAGHFDRVPPFAMFASQDLLHLVQEAAQGRSLSKLPLYRLSVPGGAAELDQYLSRITTLDDLITATKGVPSM